MTLAGLSLFVVLLALAIEIGRFIAERALGEREPLTTAALGVILGLATLGFFGNLLWRLTLRTDVAFPLLVPVLLLSRVALGRWRPTSAAGPPPLTTRTRVAAAALALLVTVPMALVLGSNHMWDEWDAHLPLVNSMANGVFPPVLAYMPDMPFLYHYGYDLLAAMAVRLTHLPADQIFDILSTLLFLSYILVAAALIRRHAGGTLSPYVFGATLAWMGGLIWLRSLSPTSLDRTHLGALVGWGLFDGYPPLPAPHSYFMQKPMALALPLWIATLMLWLEAERRSDLGLAALAGFFLGFLELSEFAFFALTAATIMAFAIVGPPTGSRSRTLAAALVTVGVGTLLAFGNGGFLTRPQGASLAIDVALRIPYFRKTLPTQAGALSPFVWQMGLPMILAPLSVHLTLRRRDALPLWLLIFGAGSFIVPHVVRHRYSENIEKFFLLAVVGLGLLLLVQVQRALGERRLRPALAALLVVALTGNAPLWVLYFLRDAPHWTDYVNNPSIPYDAAAADWLHQHAEPHDRVLTSRIYVAALGGLLTPLPIGVRYQADRHGWDPRWVQFTTSAVDRALRDLNAEDLARLRIRWFVRCYLDEVWLDPPGLVALQDAARFRKVFELRRGPEFIEVYEYLPAPPSIS